MDPNEAMTNEELNDEALEDDAFFGEVVEEDDEEPAESLDSVTEDEGEPEPQQQPAQNTTQQGKQGTGEPGYVQGRIDKAVRKALAEARTSIKAELEAEYAPIKERLLEMDAQELVRTGEFKTLETAKEYLRLKRGQAAPETPAPEQQQPRNDKGQFAPKDQKADEIDPEARVRAKFFRAQAEKVKASTGLDVIAEFNNNEEIRNKVISGEMDFYDVANEMKKAGRRRPPAPMRSPNGASSSSKNKIDAMSDAEFERMDENIDKGKRYRLA